MTRMTDLSPEEAFAPMLVEPSKLRAAPLGSPPTLGRLAETPPDERLEEDGEFPLPKILHLTCKTKVIPHAWRPAYVAWKKLHPDFQVILWTDATIRTFMTTFFPQHLALFDWYSEPIERVDCWRYFVLKHYGGFYCDLDQKPTRNIKSMFRGTKCEVYLTAKHVALVTNSFMASRIGAPFWDTVIEELYRAANDPRIQALNTHFRVMCTTGPWMLTRALQSYKTGVIGMLPPVFNPQHYDDLSIANTYMEKLEGGSWHKWDSKLLERVAPHTTLLIVVLVVCCFLGLCLLGYLLVRAVWWACQKSVGMVDARLEGLHQLTTQPRTSSAPFKRNLDQRAPATTRYNQPQESVGGGDKRTLRLLPFSERHQK